MDQETADSKNEVTVTVAVASEEGSEAEADNKPANMRLRAAVKALVSSSMEEDEELRVASSQSLVKLASLHPLTVLTEWHSCFTTERDKCSKSLQKKKAASNERQVISYLIECLEPVIGKMVESQNLDGGDVRHRAVIGQIMSSLAEEMLTGTDQLKIQDILVILAKHFMDKVMDVLLLHFQPNSVKLHRSIVDTFGALSTTLPKQVVPFSKSIISTSIQLCKQLKQNDMELKGSFCDFLTKLFGAVINFDKANNDPDNEAVINKEQLTSDADNIYDIVFSHWLQTKDIQAKAKCLLLMSTISPLLTTEVVMDKAIGYLSSLTVLYKKTPFYELSLSIRQLLTVLTTSEVLLLESVLDPLLTALFQQVCLSPDFSQSSHITNQLEVLRCFNILMRICSEKILHLVLTKIEASDEKARIGSLLVVRNILTLERDIVGSKLQDILEMILQRVNIETSIKAKKVLLQIVRQLSHHGEPKIKPQRKVLVEFVVKHCEYEDTDNIGRESEDVLQTLAKTKEYQELLWTYLIEFILENKNIEQHSALYHNLSNIAELKIKENDITFNFVDPKSFVNPYNLLARLIVVASSNESKEQSINVLKFLQHFSPNINRHLVDLWTARIPLLVHYLENNQEVDSVQWTNWLCVFTTDSINQIGMEEWSCQFVTALVDQLEFQDHQSFTVQCCAHVMTVLSTRQVLEQLLDLFFSKCFEEAIEAKELLNVIQLASTKHFELVLKKLETLYVQSLAKKNKFLKFIKEKLNDDRKHRETVLMFKCLGVAIKGAPLKELEFCADGISKKFLYQSLLIMKETKDRGILDATLECIVILCDTVKVILQDNPDFKLSQKAELLQSAMTILQDDLMPCSLREKAISTFSSLLMLPPNVGQLTRCSILRSSFTIVFQTEHENTRQDFSNLLEELFRQDSHSSVVEEIFSMLETFIKTDSPFKQQALQLLSECLCLFLRSSSSEEQFSPMMIGHILPHCFDDNSQKVAIECFDSLLMIYSRSHNKEFTQDILEGSVADNIIKVMAGNGEDLLMLLSIVCESPFTYDTCEVIKNIVESCGPCLSDHVVTIVTKICTAPTENYDATADIVALLASQNILAVVDTLVKLHNVAMEDLKTTWTKLSSDNVLSKEALNILLEKISFDIMSNNDERENIGLAVLGLSLILESRKLEAECEERFVEIFTKCVYLLSMVYTESDTYSLSMACLRNMFSTLGCVVVSSNIMANETLTKRDLVTKMVSTICYHSPRFLERILSGVTPFILAVNVSNETKEIFVTILSVILTEKADNNPSLITNLVDVLTQAMTFSRQILL